MSPDETAPAEKLQALGGKLQTSSIASNDFSICVVGLDFTDKPITDADVSLASKLPYLRTLILRSTKISDQGLTAFEDSQRLETVDLSHTALSGAGLHSLRASMVIKDLNLSNSQFDDSGIANLMEIGLHLSRLNLAGTKVTDEGLEPLRNLHGLEVLDLSHTALSGLVLRYLPTGLKQLNLADTQVTDARLARLDQFKQLEVLNLSGTKITDDAVPHLIAMIEAQDRNYERRKLKYLDLRKTSVSEKALEKLKSIAPELKVER